MIANIDAQNYQENGIKPFALVDDLNRFPSIWMKKLP